TFSLLGSGVFASRLAHALFDPTLETAERQRGVARQGVMGLRLGTRGKGRGSGETGSWPPGGSELRLVLAGVLGESYAAISPPRPNSRPGSAKLPPAPAAAFGVAVSAATYNTPATLPGDLSFGVRSMTTAEMEACLDPSSLSALDFLRLVYKPPAPLDAVITPSCLFMYDRAFRALLRCLRVQFVMGELFRASKSWDDSVSGVGRHQRLLGLAGREDGTAARAAAAGGEGDGGRRGSGGVEEVS
ncbi:hypothetical protein V495_03793, partial [Pseudogymnoascus sp. VKM F-4514 (FW-929)]